MEPQEINQEALALLTQQEWQMAQQLFFENARKNPSHQTYNNLGYFLITEGLTCANDKVRNALKLGWKYLLKASEMQNSQINYNAMAVAINYELRSASVRDKPYLYQKLYNCFMRAEKIKVSYIVRYNRIRAGYLVHGLDENTLSEARKLAETFPCEESIKLCAEFLRLSLFHRNALAYIINYPEYFDDAERLMFYATTGMFEEGFKQCEPFMLTFAADRYTFAAIAECCIKTGHLDEAKRYARKIEDAEREIYGRRKKLWMDDVFSDLEHPSEYRRSLLQEYQAIPQMITPCCYFGCTMHGIEWNINA